MIIYALAPPVLLCLYHVGFPLHYLAIPVRFILQLLLAPPIFASRVASYFEVIGVEGRLLECSSLVADYCRHSAFTLERPSLWG